jgi:hypothetical protein
MLGTSESSNTAGGASFAGGFFEESLTLGSGGVGVTAEAKSSKSLTKTGTDEGEKSCEWAVATRTLPQRNKIWKRARRCAGRRNMGDFPSKRGRIKAYAKQQEKRNESNRYVPKAIHSNCGDSLRNRGAGGRRRSAKKVECEIAPTSAQRRLEQPLWGNWPRLAEPSTPARPRWPGNPVFFLRITGEW